MTRVHLGTWEILDYVVASRKGAVKFVEALSWGVSTSENPVERWSIISYSTYAIYLFTWIDILWTRKSWVWRIYPMLPYSTLCVVENWEVFLGRGNLIVIETWHHEQLMALTKPCHIRNFLIYWVTVWSLIRECVST